MTAPAARHPDAGPFICGELGPPIHKGGKGYACSLHAGHPGTVVVAKVGTYRGHIAKDGNRVLDTWVSKT